MIYLQITANTGPAECCLAVAKVLTRLLKDADQAGVQIRIFEQMPGPCAGTFRSVLLELTHASQAETAQAFAKQWQGSLLWICDSPYRPAHRRKNWFVGGSLFVPDHTRPDSDLSDSGIIYEATRASGPGGQHVNKTDSAIRATHVATGISVKVQTERSQFANKRLATQLLGLKLAELRHAKERDSKAERHMQHHTTERGNASRVFVGPDFKEQAR
ncbi:peptide chain release factor H [Undibacterium sp. CY18W]|uniref:Peptide chain release factor H n=1 Tax=Undibacterium hunanense TaxID=2762292 RepID=A0ABR6ZZE1_9BURK|nr:peptide chain release factor H [Undibacterium hunanense]MBC3920955.1 peptide chain release factor H [Undibacterium hunanense]